MKRTLLSLFFLGMLTLVTGQIKLPGLVGDHMVLQQNRNAVKIWGWTLPRTEVSVVTSWKDFVYLATSDDEGRWEVGVTTPAAGGPYEITVSDKNSSVTVRDVMIGEVWVCSGQSNMEMTLRGFPGQPVEGAMETIAHAGKYPNLRLFTVKKIMSEEELEDTQSQWAVSSPESAYRFSSTAYYFGRNLHEILGVPVGLISTNWSGSYIEAWMDAETLKELPPPAEKNTSATLLYKGMIKPVVKYGIAGFIWYQGESNRVSPGDYAKRMESMIALWRREWAQGDLPFYFVQIAPYIYGDGPDGISGALIREQQLLAMNTIPNTGMAVIVDAGDPTNIHPANKKIVGERLSYWALGDTYGIKGIPFRSPEYKSMTVEGNRVKVLFDYAEEFGLAPWDTELDGFELAGADRIFYPATAMVDKNDLRNTVTVTSEAVPEPVAVRYGFRNYSPGVLSNPLGLPASPFRSDDWEVPEVFGW